MEKPHATEAEVHNLITEVVKTWEQRRLHAKRKALSQHDLGDAAHVHPMSISRYERGAKAGALRDIPLNHFIRVEAVLAKVGQPHKATASLVAALRALRKGLSPHPNNS